MFVNSVKFGFSFFLFDFLHMQTGVLAAVSFFSR